jgi:PadR family transcriptional regulator AphA
MSLKHAILVLLENQPGSGYDLSQRFQTGIGNFWEATHQQVYQELKQLHAAKHVEFEIETQAERPDRKVYRITRAGHRALQAWFKEPVRAPRVRDALLVKLFGAHLADQAGLVAELESHEVRHRGRLEEYRLLEAQYFAQDQSARRKYRWPYLTLRRGIRYEIDWIEWLAETRRLLADDDLPAEPVKQPRKARG